MNFLSGFRNAIRQINRTPGFTFVVIATLALGIGVNTAIFSLVNALLLERLPYSHPEHLGTIYVRYGQTTGRDASEQRVSLNDEQWELLRDNVPSLISGISGSISGVNLQAASQAQYVHNGRISAHYLDAVGIHPFVGRTFIASEDLPHGPKAVVISYRLWSQLFHADPNALGKTILLKSEPYTLIGVLPQGATTPLNADVYTALQATRNGEGSGTNFSVVVRLRDGATWQEANTEINFAWKLQVQKAEKRNPGRQVSYYCVPLQRAQTDTLRPQVLALMLASGFILLIGCANLAGLTLVCVIQRIPEVATRMALGASRWQIQKQLWIENLLLALMGGAAGVGIGAFALRGLLLMLPEHFLPVADVRLDGKVLAFTLLLSLLTSILVGMLPALATRKIDLRSSMVSRTVITGGNLRLRQSLIAGEVALTVVLLAASGLLIRTLIHLETLPSGFNPNGVMAAKISLDDARFHDPVTFGKLLNESTAAMRQIPGVQSAAVGLSLPYEPTLNDWITLSDGKEAGRQDGTDLVYVTPEYFQTLQLNLISGRLLTEGDGPDTQHVAVVNRAFAHKFYGGANPVGRVVDKNVLIVGEVADVYVHSGLYEGAPLMSEQTMYVPATQVDPQLLSLVHMWFQPDWIVRTTGPISGLTGKMQQALANVDPNLPFSGFYSMDDLLARTLSMQRIEVALLGTMAALALLLSIVGISALVANMVAQRTREIGIRMAMGSTVEQAMARIARAGISASVAGLVLGLGLCAITLRVMRSLLYGVDVHDASTLLAVVFILGSVTLLATTLPALRIAKIDPAKTLREE